MAIAELRREYNLTGLRRAELEPDPVAQFNRWFEQALARHPPPLVGARRLRLRYMTQVNTRPPSFALFASRPGELPESYRRYLVNALRQDFDLPGTPIRVMLRKGDNPYAGD